jgi:hypothetical protein
MHVGHSIWENHFGINLKEKSKYKQQRNNERKEKNGDQPGMPLPSLVPVGNTNWD